MRLDSLLVGMLIAVVTAAVFVPVAAGDPDPEVCPRNLKVLANGVFAYSSDHDDRLPLAPEWMDSIAVYVKSPKSFRCPAAGGFHGYAMNSALSGIALAGVSRPGTPLLYDSEAKGRNRNDPFASVPSIPRHAEGSYVCDSDGSVRVVRP